jgi:hypothetical protein
MPQVFNRTFVSPENSRYLGHISTCYLGKRWTGRALCLKPLRTILCNKKRTYGRILHLPICVNFFVENSAVEPDLRGYALI